MGQTWRGIVCYLQEYSQIGILQQNKYVVALLPVTMVWKEACQLCPFPNNKLVQIGMKQVYMS